ncbi:MAG TPA: hypothetical protein VES19_14180 [Candidatus Limnocylindrales bacterium]|nr:hypothetical protein [Candidatus Limnocylindrales bacterium]
MPSLVAALLLAAHGLVHLSFVSPRPPAKPGAPLWPFDLGRSWLLTPPGLSSAATRAIGIVLLVAVLAGYLAAILGVIGTLPALFVPGIVVGSVASIVMLALFFHPWLVFGFVIDAVLLWAVLINGWRPGA